MSDSWTHLFAWLAVCVYAGLGVLGGRVGKAPRLVLWALAWWLHGVALVGSIFGAVITFGFGPAVSATAWLVLCVYAIESKALPQLRSNRVALVLAGVAVAIGVLFPGHPLPAATSIWQPVHWALGITSYGVFAMAVIHAGLTTSAERRFRLALAPVQGLPVLTLERLTFHLVTAGFGLLTLMLVLAIASTLGWLGSSGTAWRWDHKTVLSLLAWLVFAVLLAGRYVQGWRGRKALGAVYLGAGLLFLAYVGSHFVKEIVLQR